MSFYQLNLDHVLYNNGVYSFLVVGTTRCGLVSARLGATCEMKIMN